MSEQKIGLAAARWFALRPGDFVRWKACEALLEADRVAETIPLLQYIAYECFGESAQYASQRLLMLKETERILPVLSRNVFTHAAVTRYNACFMLALANIPPPNDTTTIPERLDLRLSILERSYT